MADLTADALVEAREIAEEIVRERGPDRVMEVQRARMWDRKPSEWTRYERHLAEAFIALAARGSAEPPTNSEIEQTLKEALRYAFEGRRSHGLWAEHLEAHANGGTACDECTAEVVKTAGDAAEQREWVRKYDAIIEGLKLNSTPLMLGAIAKISDEENHKARVRAVKHALRYRSLAGSAEPTEDTLAEIEGDLRREWFVNHGCDYHALYGDDGEMQCANGRPFHLPLDFKRQPIAELRIAVRDARLARGAATSRGVSAETQSRETGTPSGLSGESGNASAGAAE